ncbi:unnamed protein product [Arabis nemorensis]|uniref:Uncharacterized protein n=1 Tax=Arabis nemorensis TaxID=586526 RepID=A0A565BL53_9BRAS|nr:unnamed protein product [Arabis nemorensis]
MVLGYETDAQRDLSSVREARVESKAFEKQWRDKEVKGFAERENAAKEISDLKSSVGTLEKSYKEARDEVVQLNHSITKRDSLIAQQQRVIDAATDAYDS